MCGLRKAFDSVNRDLLWHKLRHFMELKVNFSPSFKACMYEEVLSSEQETGLLSKVE